eukprot:Gregarina_sp_Poly_1__9655@NODE_611_length_7145_cov_95_802063_g467_i0_p2_GENE_NODE_611_length_7145_cov_95_802063_g467_i0NODE_611_length_7145_cov_95_802063_g467_i0_p2_ORF_typecomplete_len462_score70_85tRNAsynt_1b/PF00579_25/1_5e70tRNAsynt_2c/PF01411_19/0_14_NODE_611_length_7145_cov_95_802063_g467_i01541539
MVPEQQRSSVEECWAHNPKIPSFFFWWSVMASPFTGSLKFWDVVAVSRASKSGGKSESAQNEAVSNTNTNTAKKDSTNQGGFLQKPGLLEVVKRNGVLPKVSTLSLDAKCDVVMSIAEECIQPDELRTLFEKKEHPICYDGFEPSGRMHIAQGILKVLNVNKLTSCGCVFVFWVADFFAMLNNKMGGDLRKIRTVGEYFVEVWKAAGMDLHNVRFLWTSEEIARDPENYWKRVMDVAKKNSINRMKRCCQIMGRAEGDDQPCANILYPCMQCSDIFYIGADMCQLGMDQRKVNVLAREYVDDWNNEHKKESGVKLRKPVIISHAMLPGLLEGQAKMSKSDPDSAIFMEDSPEDVRRKVKKAFCPPEIVEGNPVIAYADRIIFGSSGMLEVKRSPQNGGDVVYHSIESLKEAYSSGSLHPSDLKTALAGALNQLLQPVRDHFANDPHARKLLTEIRAFKVTR